MATATRKELTDRITIAFNKIMELHQNITYVHTLMLKYIAYKDDEKGFLKFVEEDRETQEAKVREDENKLKQS